VVFKVTIVPARIAITTNITTSAVDMAQED